MFFHNQTKNKRRKITLPDKSENLFIAIDNNDIETAELLLTQLEEKKITIDLDYTLNRVKVREFDSYEAFSLLCFAIHEGHLPIAKLLIEKGANVNMSGKYAQTPLQLAVLNLLSCVYDEEQVNGHSANDYQAIIEILLTNGADPNSCTNSYGVIDAFLTYSSEEIKDEALNCFRTLFEYGFRISLFENILKGCKQEASELYSKYVNTIRSEANIKRAALWLCLGRAYNTQPLSVLPLNIIKQIAMMARDNFCHNEKEGLNIAETIVKTFRNN